MADALVLGSRGHGPAGSVLTGSVSWRVARNAAGPPIVVPRGAGRPLADLFDGVSGKLRTHSTA